MRFSVYQPRPACCRGHSPAQPCRFGSCVPPRLEMSQGMAGEQGFSQKTMMASWLLRPARSASGVNGNSPTAARHRVTPGICPLSSAFRCALPASPPGTAGMCSAKDRDARNSRRRISHPLGSTQPCACGWQCDDAPQVPGAAPWVGDVCGAVPSNTRPASRRDLKGVAGSWGQTPGLAEPHVLL